MDADDDDDDNNSNDGGRRLLPVDGSRKPPTSSQPGTPLPVSVSGSKGKRASGRGPISKRTSQQQQQQRSPPLPGAMPVSSPVAAARMAAAAGGLRRSGSSSSGGSSDSGDGRSRGRRTRLERDAAPFSSYNPQDVAMSGIVQAFVKAYMARRALALSASYLEEDASWVGTDVLDEKAAEEEAAEETALDTKKKKKRKGQQKKGRRRASAALKLQRAARRDSLWQSITSAFVRQPASAERRESVIIPLSPASARPADPATPTDAAAAAAAAAAGGAGGGGGATAGIKNKNKRFLFPHKEV